MNSISNSKTEYKIENLKITDAKSCEDIWQGLQVYYGYPVGGSWDLNKLNSEILDHQGLGVFDARGHLLAFCLYRRLVSDIIEIQLLATRPRSHRSGLMRELMRTIQADLQPQERIWLEVHAGNLPAIRLYENLGFQNTGERPSYYADGGKALLFEYNPLL